MKKLSILSVIIILSIATFLGIKKCSMSSNEIPSKLIKLNDSTYQVSWNKIPNDTNGYEVRVKSTKGENNYHRPSGYSSMIFRTNDKIISVIVSRSPKHVEPIAHVDIDIISTESGNPLGPIDPTNCILNSNKILGSPLDVKNFLDTFNSDCPQNTSLVQYNINLCQDPINDVNEISSYAQQNNVTNSIDHIYDSKIDIDNTQLNMLNNMNGERLFYIIKKTPCCQ